MLDRNRELNFSDISDLMASPSARFRNAKVSLQIITLRMRQCPTFGTPKTTPKSVEKSLVCAVKKLFWVSFRQILTEIMMFVGYMSPPNAVVPSVGKKRKLRFFSTQVAFFSFFLRF